MDEQEAEGKKGIAKLNGEIEIDELEAIREEFRAEEHDLEDETGSADESSEDILADKSAIDEEEAT